MKTFLQQVAKDLYSRFGNNLSGITIVFPGKRASMWMNEYLFQCAQGPVWAPRYITIDELFLQFSDLTPSDPIRNICTLYRIYQECVQGKPLSADDFYGWGEILMNDFEDIDKHLVNVDGLFSNVRDLQALESSDFLNDKQIETLQEFFTHFSLEERSKLQQKFLKMWQAMPQMYTRLHETLRKQGLMYKGAIYREVAEALADEDKRTKLLANDPTRQYIFIGFNVLDDVEETLFTTFRDEQRALFYWDYDNWYIRNEHNEAGLFLRQNLQLFPNALPQSEYNNLMGQPKKIRYIATSTDNAQVRYLPNWLRDKLTDEERDSAVVLCDEGLMRPVLHSIPSLSENPDSAPQKPLNVTMGFPLTDTPVYGFFRALIDLQIDGWDSNLYQFRATAIERVTQNALYAALPESEQVIESAKDNLTLLQWLQHIMKVLGAHYASIEQPTIWEQLYSESIFQLYRIITQFHTLVLDGILLVKANTLRRLMLQILSQSSVPFHGEMSDGLQVMGLLETRNLDFSHLLLLSVGEGILPKKANDVSLIPYCLRSHFGLSTIERKISVFAYYFYRIIQRAEDITLVYNENSSGATQREQSRFLRQLLAETDLPIECIRLTPQQHLNPVENIQVEKDKNVMDILTQEFDCNSPVARSLSPSAINRFLTCPLSFYYQQIAKIRIEKRPQDGIDGALFGTLFHDTSELFYRHLAHKCGDNQVTQAALQPYTENKGIRLEKYLDLIFWVEYFHPEMEKDKVQGLKDEFLKLDEQNFALKVRELYDAPTPEGKRNWFTGINMIIHEVLISYLIKLLQVDMATAPFQIIALERNCSMHLEIDTPAGKRTIKTGGRIDRLDYITSGAEGPAYRIVDYKTTTSKIAPANIESIFQEGDKGGCHYYLQTMLYALAECAALQGNIQPALFYVPSVKDPENYDPVLSLGNVRINNFRDLAGEYREGLQSVVARIFNPEEPFYQTQDINNCKYCDYIRLCGRRIKK